MRRLVWLLAAALALPVAAQDTVASAPCRMDGTDCVVVPTYATMPAPTGAVAGNLGVFLGSPLRLSYDAGLTYDAATDTLTSGAVFVSDGSIAAPKLGFAGTTIGFWRSTTTVGLTNGASNHFTSTTASFNIGGPTLVINNNSGSNALTLRGSLNTLQLGAADSATPAAQTLQAQGSRGGTDTNIAGANLTIQGGAGTGNATGGSVLIRVPNVTGSGTTQQPYVTRITAADGFITLNGSVYPGSNDTTNFGASGITWANIYLSRATLGSKSKAVPDNAATAFATIPMAVGAATGGKLIYRYVVTSGTSRQVVSGSINYAAARDGATYAVDYDEIQQSTAVTTGTLAGSVTAAGASDLLTFTATFDSSLDVAGTLYYRFDSTDTLAVTPL